MRCSGQRRRSSLKKCSHMDWFYDVFCRYLCDIVAGMVLVQEFLSLPEIVLFAVICIPDVSGFTRRE